MAAVYRRTRFLVCLLFCFTCDTSKLTLVGNKNNTDIIPATNDSNIKQLDNNYTISLNSTNRVIDSATLTNETTVHANDSTVQLYGTANYSAQQLNQSSGSTHSLHCNQSSSKTNQSFEQSFGQPEKSNSTQSSTVGGDTREDVANHTHIASFTGGITKLETGTVGEKETNGTRSIATYNETNEFSIGNNSYNLCNLTSVHNASRCYLKNNDETDSSNREKTVASSIESEHMNKTKDREDSTNEKLSKKCETKELNTQHRDIFDMFSSDNDNDITAANINCVRERRRLTSNHLTHRKNTTTKKYTNNGESSPVKVDTKTDEKSDEKNEKSHDEVNSGRKQSNEEQGKSNEEREKQLELTKHKILNDIRDQEKSPLNTDDDRNFENKTIPIDPSMLPNNKTVDENNPDADVGIVGIDTHPAIEPETLKELNKAVLRNTTTGSNDTSNLQNVTKIRKKRILCFGDSLTRGMYNGNGEGGQKHHPYTIKLSELLRKDKKFDYEIINDGVNGDCVFKQMKARLPDAISDNMPLNLVIILGGTNDLLHADCIKDLDIFQEIKNLHAMVHKQGIKSCVVTIPEVAVDNGTVKMSTKQYKEIWGEVNQKLRMYVYGSSQREQFILSDIADEFTRKTIPSKTNMTGMWDDSIHPSKEGYDRIGEIIYGDIFEKF